MAKKRSTEVKVGITVVLAVVVFIALLFSVGDLDCFRGGYTLTVIFDSAAGLVPDAKVLYAGVRAGNVESVEWYRPENTDELKVKIVIWLEDQVVVREDSVVAIRIKGLMAEKYVDISPGSPDSPAVQPGRVIYGQTTVGMEELFESAGSIVVKIGDALAEISQMFDEEAVASFKSTLAHIDSIVAELDALIRLSAPEVSATLHNVRMITGDVAGFTGSLDRIGTKVENVVDYVGPRIESTMEHVVSITAEVDNVVSHLNDIVAAIASGEGTAGKLIYDDRTYDELNQSLEKAKELLDAIIENPRDYLNLSVF